MKPWMMYVAVAVVAIAVGFGAATLLSKRRQKKDTPDKRATGLTPTEAK
jgi:hypothetical protein